MKILLLGPQGCGKGTAGQLASQQLGIPLIGSGGLLRNMSPEHPRYDEIQGLMKEGQLVPQDFVASLLNDYTARAECANGYILEGWGRAMIDLEHFNPGFDVVVVINLSRESSIKRITGRRICSSNGKTYNIYTLPEELLAECEGELIQRDDDTEEAVNIRLDTYYSLTQEVIDSFKAVGSLVEVDGEQSPEDVARDIVVSVKAYDKV